VLKNLEEANDKRVRNFGIPIQGINKKSLPLKWDQLWGWLAEKNMLSHQAKYI